MRLIEEVIVVLFYKAFSIVTKHSFILLFYVQIRICDKLHQNLILDFKSDMITIKGV